MPVGVEFVDDGGGALVASSSLATIQSKARSARRQVRDDVGRWRKIYYRLRRDNSSPAKIRAALRLIKDAERRRDLGQYESAREATEAVRVNLKTENLSRTIDERVDSALLREAAEAARLSERLEALGPDTLVSIGQLPQAFQDAIKDYLRHQNLEPRITKHFEPFRDGKIRRSVKDVLNLIDRTVIDDQVYSKGYDREHS